MIPYFKLLRNIHSRSRFILRYGFESIRERIDNNTMRRMVKAVSHERMRKPEKK